MTSPAAQVRPLSGLRVIEVSAFVAAPLGGLTLAELGAEVIRIDPIGGAADRSRWPLAPSGTSLYWAGLNKGKKSITVDFKSDTGRNLIRDLVAAGDPGRAVLLTNAVGRPWLEYESLTQQVPDLIHVQIQGRRDGAAAVDYTVNAAVGFPMVTGPEELDSPVNHVLPAWDIACGLYAALAVSAAQVRRSRTGCGERIQIALEDVALAVSSHLGFLTEAQLHENTRTRIGNHLYGGFARDFTCRDGGRIMLVALTQRHWDDLVALTGTADTVSALESTMKLDFSREDHRFECRELLAGLIQRWFSTQTTGQACAALAGTAVLWDRYRTFREAMDEIRRTSHPLMNEIDQPGVGPHLVPGSPLRLTSSPHAGQPAPQLGQNTHTVLAEDLGLKATEIDRLVLDGVIAGSHQPWA